MWPWNTATPMFQSHTIAHYDIPFQCFTSVWTCLPKLELYGLVSNLNREKSDSFFETLLEVAKFDM